MKALPYWFFGLATLFVIVGMAWGVQMSATQNFELAPAHAHNNLIGFVVMTIYGVYYRLVPAAAEKRLALVQFWLALLGALTFAPGIALAILSRVELLVQVSTVLVLLSMLIFSYTVWTNKAGLTNP